MSDDYGARKLIESLRGKDRDYVIRELSDESDRLLRIKQDARFAQIANECENGRHLISQALSNL